MSGGTWALLDVCNNVFRKETVLQVPEDHGKEGACNHGP